MSSTMLNEPRTLVEIDVGHKIHAALFTADGEYLVSGGSEGVRVWRVQDGKEMSTMKTRTICSLAVAQDGKWIAAGTSWGHVFLWDAKTYQQVFPGKEDDHTISAVDFSADSTWLVSASWNCTATMWNITARRRARTLRHEYPVIAAKYSQEGDRIATATVQSIQVWDSNDGRLLVDISMQMTPLDTGILWFNNYIFVVRKRTINQIDPSTGSAVSEWPVSGVNYYSCVAPPQHEAFIAYATDSTVTFWNASKQTQLDLIQCPQYICSVSHSPDGRFLRLAIDGSDGTIAIKTISHFTDPIPLTRLHPTLKEPEVHIDDAILDSWKHDQLANAEKLLTAAIPESRGTVHHVLASRALVRARLGQWDAAILDAEESVNTELSVIGYIAKFVALVGKRKMNEAYRTYDIALEYFHSSHVTILLLVKAVVTFMAGEHDDAVMRVENLIAAVRSNSIFYMVQAYMYFLLGNLHMERNEYELAIQSFEHAQARLGDHSSRPPLLISLVYGWKFDDLTITIQQHLCKALYAAGRTEEARESLLAMVDKEVNITGPITVWFTDFMQRCLSSRGSGDDQSRKASDPPFPSSLLRGWTRLKLASGSWKDALAASVDFVPSRFLICRAMCERLETMDRIMDAVACFHQMSSEFVQDAESEQVNWIIDFKSRSRGMLEDMGDTAMNAHQYDEAISYYTSTLSLNFISPQALLIKRSKAHAAKGLWRDALNDANEVINLEPSSPLGYEMKHAALHGARYYGDAIGALETMLSKMSQSSDPKIRKQSSQYVKPEETKAVIRAVIQSTIRESPLVLISTHSGRLVNKSEQASSLESQPVFEELISSMTTEIDRDRIKHEVAQHYRYAMLSHKWEENEPLFEKVINIAVHDLEESPTHSKLKIFCKMAREAGLNWAWSDTCCINKGDHFVLQEALVSMFKWYQGSSLTIIFLRGVRPLSLPGDLMRSIWNTRAWTLQEYHASKVVQFYTEEWTPYMDLDSYNHKESPKIISEMEDATGVSARALSELRPGLDDVRAKLRLASTRQTTRVEDAAYSLLGIFSLTLPVVYGEGDKALGRLLAQVLTSSGDMSILAWTGSSGSFNSCLPADIAVFHRLETSHIPSPITGTEAETIAARPHASSLNIPLVTKLYDRLNELPVPSFAERRMKLPCLIFKLGRVSASRNGSEHVFRAETSALGVVEIKTDEDLSRLDSLCLIHPWIDFLLDRQLVQSTRETKLVNNIDYPDTSDVVSTTLQTRASQLVARFGNPFGGRKASHHPPPYASPMEKQIRVLQFILRLRQPFGALLLTPTRQHVEEYRRVATGCLITVRVEEITSVMLDRLIQDVRMLDVL